MGLHLYIFKNSSTVQHVREKLKEEEEEAQVVTVVVSLFLAKYVQICKRYKNLGSSPIKRLIYLNAVFVLFLQIYHLIHLYLLSVLYLHHVNQLQN